MVSENLFQGIVKKVGSCMVGSRGITLVGIYTCHKLCCRVLRKLFYDVYCLVVLTL